MLCSVSCVSVNQRAQLGRSLAVALLVVLATLGCSGNPDSSVASTRVETAPTQPQSGSGPDQPNNSDEPSHEGEPKTDREPDDAPGALETGAEGGPTVEAVPLRGVVTIPSEFPSFFSTCDHDSDELVWAVSFRGEAADTMRAFTASHADLPCMGPPGGGSGGACHVYVEGVAIVGEPGKTDLIEPSPPGRYSREVVFTSLELVELLEEAACPSP